jgi:D-tyrosyl-tRNA(Tyr) deacylase
MRAVLTRVTSASVRVDDALVGAIEDGVLVLIGVAREDTEADADTLARKIVDLRIFRDEAGAMNRSLTENGGSALVVSQFTLLGDARKGRRPSFMAAAEPAHGRPLYEAFVAAMRGRIARVETGVFGATMAVASVNDGPVTILLDTTRLF